jgi:hypothetical protein
MIVKNEFEFKQWFRKNYRKFGFSKIVRDDIGEFPDFIMLKDNKDVRIELEILASNFELHNHSLNKVDEIFCLINDSSLKIPITEIKQLKYQGKLRISATVDKETVKILEDLVDQKKYRNYSHAIESAIELLKKISEEDKK